MTAIADEDFELHHEGGDDEALSIRCSDSAPEPVPPPTPTYVLSAFKLYVETLDPLAGWGMTLYHGDACTGEPIDSGNTDGRGMLDFNLPAPGVYSIQEEERSGWTALDGDCQSSTLEDLSQMVVFRGVPDHNGDVNIDSTSNSIDAVLVLQDVVGLANGLPDAPQGDVDRDLELTAVDSNLILQYDAGLIGNLPVSR